MQARHGGPRRAVFGAITSLLLLAVAVLTLGDGAAERRAADSARTRRPNFVLIVADDQQAPAFGGYDSMPILRERFLPTAVDFSLGFATNPACCPMRATLLTGGYPRRHGTEAVGPPLGGASKFRRDGADRETIACWLKRAGYKTGLFGKYMNFYLGEERTAGAAAPNTFYVPPCWDRWRAMASPEAYGGVYGRDYEIVAWDSKWPKPVCPDFCPPGGGRCANYSTRACSADADCRRYGRADAHCVGIGEKLGNETIASCGACSGPSERPCNDDAMCPKGEHCVLGCVPTRVYAGTSLPYGKEPGAADDGTYATDVLGELVRELVTESVGAGKPFFIVYAPPAPHAGKGGVADPPARYHGKPAEVPPWRPPSYDEADVADKPRFVARNGPSSKLTWIENDLARSAAFSALLAVDEQLGLLIDHLQRLGAYDDTVIAYVSDNGVCYGEQRQFLMMKEVPYECAIRVPIALSYPRIGRGAPRKVEDRIATLADIPVTFADLARARIPIATDGASLAGWLTGDPPKSWRRDVLLERWSRARVDCLRYSGNVRDGDRIRLQYGDRYQRDRRPSLAFEWDADGVVAPGSVAVPLGPTADASFGALQRSILRRLPGLTAILDGRRKSLSVWRQATDDEAFHFSEEVDQGQTLAPCEPVPDFYGVRDERGFKYIEYNDGERELYDLQSDPYELQNVYGDPAHGSIQNELDRRLDEILRAVPRRADRRSAAGPR